MSELAPVTPPSVTKYLNAILPVVVPVIPDNFIVNFVHAALG